MLKWEFFCYFLKFINRILSSKGIDVSQNLLKSFVASLNELSSLRIVDTSVLVSRPDLEKLNDPINTCPFELIVFDILLLYLKIYSLE